MFKVKENDMFKSPMNKRELYLTTKMAKVKLNKNI
jgi:hypothetical protein